VSQLTPFTVGYISVVFTARLGLGLWALSYACTIRSDEARMLQATAEWWTVVLQIRAVEYQYCISTSSRCRSTAAWTPPRGKNVWKHHNTTVFSLRDTQR